MLSQKGNTRQRGFRSVKYRTIRQNGSLTANTQRITNLRTKKTSLNQISPIKTQLNPEQPKSAQIFKLNHKSTYLDSFNTLMDLSDLKKQAKINLNQNNSHQIKLINFVELNSSQFTTLDQINLPINFVAQRISNAYKLLKQQKTLVQDLKCQLKLMKDCKFNDLNKIEEQFLKSMTIIRSYMKKDQIHQNQFKLKTKRQIKLMKQQHEFHWKHVDDSHKKLLHLQDTIYSCRPYQLQDNHKDQQNKYF